MGRRQRTRPSLRATSKDTCSRFSALTCPHGRRHQSSSSSSLLLLLLSSVHVSMSACLLNSFDSATPLTNNDYFSPPNLNYVGGDDRHVRSCDPLVFTGVARNETYHDPNDKVGETENGKRVLSCAGCLFASFHKLRSRAKSPQI